MLGLQHYCDMTMIEDCDARSYASSEPLKKVFGELIYGEALVKTPTKSFTKSYPELSRSVLKILTSPLAIDLGTAAFKGLSDSIKIHELSVQRWQNLADASRRSSISLRDRNFSLQACQGLSGITAPTESFKKSCRELSKNSLQELALSPTMNLGTEACKGLSSFIGSHKSFSELTGSVRQLSPLSEAFQAATQARHNLSEQILASASSGRLEQMMSGMDWDRYDPYKRLRVAAQADNGLLASIQTQSSFSAFLQRFAHHYPSLPLKPNIDKQFIHLFERIYTLFRGIYLEPTHSQPTAKCLNRLPKTEVKSQFLRANANLQKEIILKIYELTQGERDRKLEWSPSQWFGSGESRGLSKSKQSSYNNGLRKLIKNGLVSQEKPESQSGSRRLSKKSPKLPGEHLALTEESSFHSYSYPLINYLEVSKVTYNEPANRGNAPTYVCLTPKGRSAVQDFMGND